MYICIHIYIYILYKDIYFFLSVSPSLSLPICVSVFVCPPLPLSVRFCPCPSVAPPSLTLYISHTLPFRKKNNGQTILTLAKILTSCLLFRLYTVLTTPGNRSFNQMYLSPWNPSEKKGESCMIKYITRYLMLNVESTPKAKNYVIH